MIFTFSVVRNNFIASLWKTETLCNRTGRNYNEDVKNKFPGPEK